MPPSARSCSMVRVKFSSRRDFGPGRTKTSAPETLASFFCPDRIAAALHVYCVTPTLGALDRPKATLRTPQRLAPAPSLLKKAHLLDQKPDGGGVEDFPRSERHLAGGATVDGDHNVHARRRADDVRRINV